MRANPVKSQKPRSARCDEGNDELVEALELAVEELGAPSQLAQGNAGGVAHHIAGPGPQGRRLCYQGSYGVLGEPCPQVTRPGQDQGPGLVDRLCPLGAGAALGDHQRADGLDGAIAALRRAAGPAGLGGPGGADGIQRVRLALPPPVLAIRAVHLHHPHAGGRDVAGQARAVAAGAFDPDQADGPEPAQPPQQAAVTGAVAGNSWTPSSPPIGSSAAATRTSA